MKWFVIIALLLVVSGFCAMIGLWPVLFLLGGLGLYSWVAYRGMP